MCKKKTWHRSTGNVNRSENLRNADRNEMSLTVSRVLWLFPISKMPKTTKKIYYTWKNMQRIENLSLICGILVTWLLFHTRSIKYPKFAQALSSSLIKRLGNMGCASAGRPWVVTGEHCTRAQLGSLLGTDLSFLGKVIMSPSVCKDI